MPSAWQRKQLAEGDPVALREFTDDRGDAWQVCNVQPAYVERRSGADRRKVARTNAAERRKRHQHRMIVAPRYREGWLIFKSPLERRRLGPIPPGWETWPDEQLRALLRDAETLRTIPGAGLEA